MLIKYDHYFFKSFDVFLHVGMLFRRAYLNLSCFIHLVHWALHFESRPDEAQEESEMIFMSSGFNDSRVDA